MPEKQSQKISDGSLAIQAKGDVTVTLGISPEQMTQVMMGLAKELANFQIDAQRVAEERLKEFRTEILQIFSDPSKASSEAFKDPDFQYLLNRAQHSYARTDDKEVGKALVHMIGERSNYTERSRISLVINQAVETVGALTKNEFAELALSFLMTQTKNTNVVNIPAFITYFQSHIKPLLTDISSEESSYTYLIAQQCIFLSSFTSRNPNQIFITHYGGIFCDGFTSEEVRKKIDDQDEFEIVQKRFTPCLNDNSKIQFDSINAESLEEKLKKSGLNADNTKKMCSLFSEKMWHNDFAEKIKLHIPEYEEFIKLWNSTPLKQMSLTALGVVIGHAKIKQIQPSLSADLSIWIK